MNIFLLNQEINQKQTRKIKFGSEANSALVMPADFSPDDELENMPRVMVIDAQPSSLNSSSRESTVVIPADLSIESHQVPIIVADQDDFDQQVKVSGNSRESLDLWNAFFVREKDQGHTLYSAH